MPSVFSDLKPSHVVVYQCKHLGDCVLTLPLVNRVLRSLHPEGRLSIITHANSQEIFERIDPRIKVIVLPQNIVEWVKLLQEVSGAHLMFLPHASSRGLAISKVLGIASVGPADLRALKLWKPTHAVPRALVPWRHTAEQYLDLGRRVGLEVAFEDQTIDLSGLLASPLSGAVMQRLPESYVVTQAGSRWMFKTPRFQFWLDVVQSLQRAGHSVVLIGGNHGHERDFIEALEDQTGATSIAGLTTISDLAHVLSRANYYLGVDTLATHLASGIGVRGIALFGPTSEKIWGPYGRNARVRTFVSNEYHCRPCHTDGCGGGKVSECLDRIRASDVINALLSLS